MEDPTAERLATARRVIEERRPALGPALIAAACYGSVAHGAARLHSDVELVVITDESVPYADEYFFRGGILVECTTLPAARMLAAASRVPPDWGITADQYRHHLVLYDPGGFFPRLHAAAHDLDPAAFEASLQRSWWTAYELRGKTLNALASGDVPAALSAGWSFAYWAAMRIALQKRVPYESGRTLWREAAARGHGMGDLIGILSGGGMAGLRDTLDEVWRHTGSGGSPPRPAGE